MIQNLEIKNFKSIEHIEFPCNRINLFIGEPNTGKSNILEALGLVNFINSYSTTLKDFIRFDSIHNIFRDSMVSNDILVSIDNKKDNIELKNSDNSIVLSRNGETVCRFQNNGDWYSSKSGSSDAGIRFYRFKEPGKINGTFSEYLTPPYGDNLFTIAYSQKEFRNILLNLAKPAGLKPVFKPNEQQIELQKQEDDVAISYPYITISDTIQRNFFYQLAIKSNKNSSLVFEEPESNSFPFYTKHLGETIARDESNQYFIATHNPYLLTAIVEQAKSAEVNIFVVNYKDYKTSVRLLNQEELADIMDQDPFLALDHYK